MDDLKCRLIISFLLSLLCCHVTGTEFLNLAISYKKNVVQSSDYTGSYSTAAENAVDGKTGQNGTRGDCTHTLDKNPSWWRVEFKDKVYIHRIVIYLRNDSKIALKRFEKSQIYISEKSTCGGNPVYTQTANPTEPWKDIINETVDTNGTFLLVCSGPSNFVHLCEVQVIGCPYSTYGDNCSLHCGKCYQSTCNLTSGICPGNCEAQYMGPMCKASCVSTCRDSTCSKDGCGDCVVGQYGVYCEKQCPENCDNNICDQHNGYCTGCKNKIFWNDNCSSECHSQCKYNMCNQDSGVCYKGCKDGFWGKLCNNTCPSKCRTDTCNQTNEYCDNGCSSGYWGLRCETECFKNCQVNACGQNDCSGKDVCDKQSGVCALGCFLNYWGDYCNQTCSANCLESECTNDTGTCVRGCSAGYRGHNCTEEEQSTRSNERNTAIYVGVAVLAIVIAFVVVLLKRQHNSMFKHEIQKAVKTQLSFRADSKGNMLRDPEKMEDGGVSFNTTPDVHDDNHYYNISQSTSGILVDDLKEYIKSQTEDGFHRMFSKIPKGLHFACDDGKSEENISKNRFFGIFPYNHSRVKIQKLTEESNSDYINANYIDSFDSTNDYIAAQGPMTNTIEDTWRMVIQERCGKIVMLTNLIEGNKKKCIRYWPTAGNIMKLSDITLTLVSEEVRSFYTIRNINVDSVNQKGEAETMYVTQFHFTCWPDHGVADPRKLVVFHRRVTEAMTSPSGPLIVHCSAGVGRTGTFIGLDALVTYGRRNKRIDVTGFVRHMRSNRLNMVQNAAQFRLLHEALYEALMYPGSSIFRTDFLKGYDQVKMRLGKEYKILQSMLPEYPPYQYSDATHAGNRYKNRNHSILPTNNCRPFISTYVAGTTDYINAVIVSGSVQISNFLVTQLPLTDTVVDFWRMVFDHDCRVAVLLNPVEETERYPAVLPLENTVLEIGRLQIKLASQKTILSDITESVIHITQQNRQKRDVIVLHTTSWNEANAIPPTKNLILDLVESVTSWQKQMCGRNIIVQCMNGATCSGLYCAVSNVIEQIKVDQVVDVFQAVREMQICRPQFMQSEAQYHFCYEIIMEYLNKNEYNLYANK